MDKKETEKKKSTEANPGERPGYAHLHVKFYEKPEGEYHLCSLCNGKTILISSYGDWAVDEEPYKSGEQIDDMAETVDVSEEITAHYCLNCKKITSLSFNEM